MSISFHISRIRRTCIILRWKERIVVILARFMATYSYEKRGHLQILAVSLICVICCLFYRNVSSLGFVSILS